MYIYHVHQFPLLPISIAQSRQQWSSLIAAAQQQPQIITNRHTPVAVLVSMDYFERSQAATSASASRFCDTLHQLRVTFATEDDMGLPTPEANARHTAWQRGNAFAQDAEDAP